MRKLKRLVGAFAAVSSLFLCLSEFPAFGANLERVAVNNPDADADLAVGLWSWIVPADVDGDGNVDLIVSCPDVPYNGTYYFRNTGDDPVYPTFEKSIRLSAGARNVQPSWVDGKLRVLTPAKEYPDFLKTGVEKPVPIKSENELVENVHHRNINGNMWKIVDFDGDGVNDLIIGTGDWNDYGWDDAFDAEGNWTNGPIRGNIYFRRNSGSDESPKYDDPIKLQAVEGGDLETYGWPSPNLYDWDGDGDLDIIGCEYRDTIYYAENVGTRTDPKYKQFVPLTLSDGTSASGELAMPTIIAFDWDKDGAPDILLGDEDGRVAFFKNTKTLKDNKPVFDPPFYFKQTPDSLKCGALSTPWGVDWDDDGDWDILCGNSAGYIFYFENLSGPGVDPPKWASPVALKSEPNDAVLAAAQAVVPKTATLVEKRRDGSERIRVMAGPNGSIQGPVELKWGYTTLSVADWDGDGLKDVVLNSILGNVFWYKNIGVKGAPKLDQPRPVEVEWTGEPAKLAWGWRFPKGKELLTQWRTTPIAIDWTGDGLTDLVMLDVEGYLALYERYKDANGELKLAPPRRAFTDALGAPLQMTSGRAGGSGRRKMCFIDYNHDGKLDLLANGLNADLYLQTGEKDGQWTFINLGPIDERNIRQHSTSPTAVDFDGDGVFDPFIGAEDGYFYSKRNDFDDKFGALDWENDDVRIQGLIHKSVLKNGEKAFENRDYVWEEVDPNLSGVEILRTLGGVPLDVAISAKKPTTIRFLLGETWPKVNDGKTYLSGEDASLKRVEENAAKYSDFAHSPLALYEKTLKEGETWNPPYEFWSNVVILLPRP